ncbi:MAG: Cell division protein ftsA [Candidatus Yanofskybacteria bacterium GW2011_GWA1_44_21]|uniref:Cell division protein FtsA n=2 Tax=Candidatus Yanofskyibacteriota TaxID=1752733 RepID=A0A1F8H301_9BACT|nr:MAG: Cell division protein ftsA [Candidatus Yanofskybacteria bacterium GW2011_GWA2_44_10]KKT50671.1 MAG: Cell division protein ftsA [Candidatus Yanofskybacteria bacterium GW2011_GWA1_44_21]KKT90199.1 MAG: Cell division protein ftsA [Candidatus Yanofskybacteria bacterium GW2011_GWB1_45_11]OGN14863.1 MAG: cell division protein FtsA [Candidatus Yanofskybacteria bacterium RIFCSPHIGHO2_02_FULL_44_36b]OGN19140.1 MAG: cell division protein FtsA [Candidatus Yanofskybacteria bacterium RIFCSPHIGHO2_12
MGKPYLISGIDIGNSQVKAVIAKIERNSSRPEIIGFGNSPSLGLRRGMVVDMEETIDNVRTAVHRAQTMAGASIQRAYVSVNGLHIGNQTSRGVIAVSRADNEISQNDIDRVVQAASVVSLPANREIIHVIPRNYIVDGTENVKNPLGMKGVRLEAEVFIIDGLSPHIRNIAKCVNENNIEVAGLVFAPVAAAMAVLDKNQKEYGVLHLDFGGGTSTLTVFEEADLLHTSVLPIGSKHITNDLAIALRTSLDVAEKIKLDYGATSETEDLRRKDMIDLSALLAEENFVVSKKQLIKVVDARAHELMDMVNAEMKKISRNGMLPAGIVLSGGGSNLPGFAMLVKEALKLPVRLATTLNMTGAENVSDPSYAVGLGLVAWGFEKEFSKGQKGPSGNNRFISNVVRWFKNFMP